MKKTIIDLIDLGGKLNTDIKAKTKDLDVIKQKLRKEMSKSKLSEAYGTEYSLAASDYTSVEVDKESVIKSLIGMRTAQIDPNEEIMIPGDQLIRLLSAANFPVKALKKIFTDDGIDAITTKTTKHFYTLKFNKAD